MTAIGGGDRGAKCERSFDVVVGVVDAGAGEEKVLGFAVAAHPFSREIVIESRFEAPGEKPFDGEPGSPRIGRFVNTQTFAEDPVTAEAMFGIIDD